MTLMMKDCFRAFRVISWLKNINQYCCGELVLYICFNPINRCKNKEYKIHSLFIDIIIT
jgi:hypothetical protein